MKYKACRVNFIGGPGIGKSTIAYKVAGYLKSEGVQTELIKEYVKDWTYYGRGVDGYDQTFLFANQLHLEDIVLENHPDTVVVSDSPLLMNSWYGLKDRRPAFQHTIEIAHEFEKDYPSLNFIINRSDGHSYSRVGRYHSLEESIEMDNAIRDFYYDAAADGRISHLAHFPADGDINELFKQIDKALGRSTASIAAGVNTVTCGSSIVMGGKNNFVSGCYSSVMGAYSFGYNSSGSFSPATSSNGQVVQGVSGEIDITSHGISLDESEPVSCGVSIDESESAVMQASKIYHSLTDGAFKDEKQEIIYHGLDSDICPKCKGLKTVKRMKNIVTEGTITYWRGDLPREEYDVPCPNCDGEGRI